MTITMEKTTAEHLEATYPAGTTEKEDASKETLANSYMKNYTSEKNPPRVRGGHDHQTREEEMIAKRTLVLTYLS